MPEPTTTEMDVFAAAAALKDQWDGDARAASPDTVEWMCTTWGSGAGAGTWLETVKVLVAAELYGLPSRRNRDGRDELIVKVPVKVVPAVLEFVDRLGNPEEWSWFDKEIEEDVERQMELAAEFLGISVDELEQREWLLELLRLE